MVSLPTQKRFLDFLDDAGRNVIRDWLATLPKKAKAKVDLRIAYLQAGTIPWTRPFVAPLKGDGLGLSELIAKHERIQYRPLFFDGPGNQDATLLVGATKTSSNSKTHWNPANAISTAKKRKKIVSDDPKRACAHDEA
jgi:hypothetical protein